MGPAVCEAAQERRIAHGMTSFFVLVSLFVLEMFACVSATRGKTAESLICPRLRAVEVTQRNELSKGLHRGPLLIRGNGARLFTRPSGSAKPLPPGVERFQACGLR